MKALTKFSTLIILILTLTIAQATSEEQEPQLNSSLIWEINGPALNDPSYILGTIHIMCEQDHKKDPRFEAALNKVEQLIVEVTVDTPEKNSEMMRAMVSDTPLEERLSPAQFAQLEEVVKKHTDYDIKIFKNMEMFAISAALLISTFDCPIVGVEDGLEEMAKQKGLPIGELETVAEQIKILKAMVPPFSDEPWTDEEMKAFGMFPETFQTLLTAYYSENISEIHQLTIEEILKVENGVELVNTLLDARNTKWVEKMPNIMKESSTLFAVGAAHLGGPNGVINLLKETGFEVKPVHQRAP